MKQLTVVNTFVSRFLILALSFALVVFSTNMWGTEGKGTISILIANSAIIGFFSNIFSGSSISYFSNQYKTEKVVPFAYIWSVFIGITIPVLFNFLYLKTDFLYYLIGISVLFSLLSTNTNLFVGKQDINKYNWYTLAQQVVHLLFIFLLFYFLNEKSVKTYFVAQILCYGVLFVVSTFQIFKGCKFSNITFEKKLLFSMFEYGWKTQLSAFIQFLNYRLSFFFLEYYLGIAYVGIFSIGVTFSEAIWTVSRSLSLVLYSDILNTKNADNTIVKTKMSLKISFLVTLAFIFLVLLIPNDFYSFVFGKQFSQTKTIILYLSPGILAIAVSNIIGFYFAGTNKLGILNIKSILGLVVTVGLSLFAIPRWGILGACVVTTLSYCVSAGILFWKFYQTTEFKLKDYFVTEEEFKLILKKIVKK